MLRVRKNNPITLGELLGEYFKPLASYQTPQAIRDGVAEPLWFYREKHLRAIDFWVRLSQLSNAIVSNNRHDDDNDSLRPEQLIAKWLLRNHFHNFKDFLHDNRC